MEPPRLMEPTEVSDFALSKIVGLSELTTIDRLRAVPQIASDLDGIKEEMVVLDPALEITDEARFIFSLSDEDRRAVARIMAVCAHARFILLATSGVLFARVTAFAGVPRIVPILQKAVPEVVPFVQVDADVSQESLESVAELFDAALLGRLPEPVLQLCLFRSDSGQIPTPRGMPEGVDPKPFESLIALACQSFAEREVSNANV